MSLLNSMMSAAISGATKAASTAASKSSGSKTSSGKKTSSGTGGSKSSSGGGSYYDPNKDYSLAIKQAQSSGASAGTIAQLQAERQNKINAQYGGVDPYKGSSNLSTGGGVYGTTVVPKSQSTTSDGSTQWAVRNQADMSRRPDLAGSYATSGGYTVFYDKDGYATKALKGVTDYTPHQDVNAANGSYNASGAWTDNEVLTPADRQRIADIRAQMQAGLISGDEANAQANAIRSGYGYTIDKSGYVTDLASKANVDARRAVWGLTSQAPTNEQVSLLQTLYPNGNSLLNQLYQQGYAADPTGQVSYQPAVSAGLGGFEESDASQYLKDMWGQKIAAELAALKSTYEQNVADVDANDDLISKTYAREKNETAAQNELMRMQMAELGVQQGLNTGTTGQMALAQNVAYQGNLANIGAQEAQSLADNALNRQKLTAAYRNAIDQAEAEGNYQMASALYDEYVRQEDMAWQRQQAAQDQANWEAQFNQSQQQYRDSLASQDREYAYNLALAALQNGIMPDSATLETAGISAADAQSLSQYYQQQAAMEAAYTRAQIAQKSSGRTSGGTSGSSSGNMTLTTAKMYANNGIFNDDVLNVFHKNGYSDELLAAEYGYSPESKIGNVNVTKETGLAKEQFDGLKRTMQTLVSQGDVQAAQKKFSQMESSLSQAQINSLINAGLISKG